MIVGIDDMIERNTVRSATVSASLFSGFLDYADQQGLERVRVLERTGLSEAALADPDSRIPLSAYIDMLAFAKTALGDPALIVRFAQDIAMSRISIVALIMESAPDMGEAFRQMQRYGRLALHLKEQDPGGGMELDIRDGRLFMVDRRMSSRLYPDLVEMDFIRLTCGPRRFLAQSHVLSVSFMHPEPPHASVCEDVFQCPVTFGAPQNALELHPEVANWPVTQNDGYVHGVLKERADTLIEALTTAPTIRAALEAELLGVLHTGEVSSETLAGRLGCTRQTLFRKLRAEGTSFRKVLAELRREVAMDYLGQTGSSVKETAYLVGFSEPAAFSRWFRRSTGLSPKQYQAHTRSERNGNALED